MSINFDKIIQRTNTNCKHWDQVYQNHSDDIIPMGIADMDFPIPSEVITAIQNRLEHPCFGYTYPSEDLKQALIDYLEFQYKWHIKKEWIIFYPDATTSLYFIFNGIKNLLPLKNQVILQPPVFGSFFNDIKRAGLESVTNPLILENDKYFMDFNHLQDIFSYNNSIHSFILCNPQNPIGRVWSKDELIKLGNICVQNQCFIISDELHSDLILPEYKHIPIASLSSQIAQNTITLLSPGKGFNIAGLKISVAIIPNDELRNQINFITNNMDPNIFGMIAYQTVLQQSYQTYTTQLTKYLNTNFEYIDSFFKSKLPQIKLIPPQATFLAWIDMRNLDFSSQELEKFLLEKAKIYATQGYTFGKEGEGFIRLNIGISISQLHRALSQLELAVKNLSL